MSILIKGMEMPTSCFECKLLDYTDTFRCRFRFESLAREHGINISRPSWCPIVSVPPHGDLIDRDALPWENQALILTDPDEWGLKAWDIEHAPTIIPAEPPKGE